MAWPEKHGACWRVRYRENNGSVRTLPEKYATRSAAKEASRDFESDRNRVSTAPAAIGPSHALPPEASANPVTGEGLTLGEWVVRWRRVHRVAPATKAKNDNFLDRKILPVFTDWPLSDIKRLAVKEWAAELAPHHVHDTIGSYVTLLSTILTAAVDEGLLDHNPIAGMRLSKTHVGKRAPKRTVLTIEQLLEGAERLSESHGFNTYAHVITAAYTGMRWGETCGLARGNIHLDQRNTPRGGAWLDIDPDEGALHEVGGRLWLGPPKSEASVRRIDLPDFLADILQLVCHSHDHDQLFITHEGHWHRRSNFRRRVWGPAFDGDSTRGWGPIGKNATFHGLRHLHKTILDEQAHSEIAKHDRMGHRMKGIAAVYSHVTPAMRHDLRTRLQQHWNQHTGSAENGLEAA